MRTIGFILQNLHTFQHKAGLQLDQRYLLFTGISEIESKPFCKSASLGILSDSGADFFSGATAKRQNLFLLKTNAFCRNKDGDINQKILAFYAGKPVKERTGNVWRPLIFRLHKKTLRISKTIPIRDAASL
jgi:hypothetical protein